VSEKSLRLPKHTCQGVSFASGVTTAKVTRSQLRQMASTTDPAEARAMIRLHLAHRTFDKPVTTMGRWRRRMDWGCA
jgi:uncharacterized RmlC-like cupin family protein